MNNSGFTPANEYSNPQPVLPDQTRMTPPKLSALHNIFIGADGLRAGWSLLIFLAMMAASFKGINAIGQLMHITPKRSGGDDSPITLTFLFIAETLPIVAMLLATWIMSKIERRPNSVYGLGGVRKISNLAAGLAGEPLFFRFCSLFSGGLASSSSRIDSSSVLASSISADCGSLASCLPVCKRNT